MDYYTDWLAVPAGARPPDHYALLGLGRFEADAKKISDASAARLRLVRQYGLKYPKESTDLLNEIAAAEVCLLDAEARTKYEQGLRTGQTAQPASAAPSSTVLSWYLQRDNQVYGPFPDHQLREMAKSGYVAPSDLVWNEQLARWVAAETVEGMAFKAKASSQAAAPEEARSDDSPKATSASFASVVEINISRLMPYKLRDTRLTGAERQVLQAEGVNDRTQRMGAGWRRTMLYAVASLCLVSALWTALIALLETELAPLNWFGVLAKIIRVLSLFALPIAAVGASVFWAKLRLSAWILLGGGVLGTLMPLLIALVPYQAMIVLDLGFGANPGSLHLCRSLPIFLALTPGAIRAGLWFKSLRPVSPLGVWVTVAAAGIHVIVYSLAFVAVNQMFGNTISFLAAILIISAPLSYPGGHQWLLKSAGTDVFIKIIATRGIHLLIFGLGLLILLVFVSTRTFDPAGHFRLLGLDNETSLIKPGTALQLILEFLARSFFVSVLVMDSLERLHQAMEK